jgi:ribosome-binding factor A
MPELEFRLDRTAERAARIDELLRQAGEAESEPENGE